MALVRKVLGTTCVLAATLALAPAQAHHSYAAFDRCTPVELEGEIANVEWANPHIRISLRTAEVASYSVEWFSLIQMERAGLAAEVLKTGDHVVITGKAMRDPSMKILSLVTEIRRTSDGWTWTRATPQQLPPDCATTN
ncbi:MAG TPA: DUF6152 family protein [Gammaproteobacteria bacterium]|nr:DUF6152 family protein [Gammaproteobacteria bacterium]